ncbi:MAG TPA: hypothetical protein VH478_13880 [Trebonia sp.]|nr:hypothetical protein [Trebonia sp.]
MGTRRRRRRLAAAATLLIALAAGGLIASCGQAAGADAYGPVEAVVIVASLLMAIACALGLYRRLAEYR